MLHCAWTNCHFPEKNSIAKLSTLLLMSRDTNREKSKSRPDTTSRKLFRGCKAELWGRFHKLFYTQWQSFLPRACSDAMFPIACCKISRSISITFQGSKAMSFINCVIKMLYKCNLMKYFHYYNQFRITSHWINIKLSESSCFISLSSCRSR